VPRDWMPTMSYDPKSGVATARGYTGQGVATANHRSPEWEPEPLRWLGARYVLRGLKRVDDSVERTGEPPTGRTLAERLGAH